MAPLRRPCFEVLVSCAWMMAALLPGAAVTGVQETARPTRLEQGRPVEASLAGGQTHTYELQIAAGQFVHVVVDQRGIDVAVLFTDPQGTKLAEVDSPNGAQGPEPFKVVTEAAGTYRLEVRAPDKAAPAGKYEARIVEIRPALQQDRDRVSADRSYAEGQALLAEGTADSSRKALGAFDRALGLRRLAGDVKGEAEALANTGSAHQALGDWTKALEFYTRALALFRQVQDAKSEGVSLANMAEVHAHFGDTDKAMALFNDALAISRREGDKMGEATTLNNIGGLYYAINEYDLAIDHFNRVVPLLRALGDRPHEAYTLINIGLMYDTQGEKAAALESYQKALPILRGLADRSALATALNNIGLLYSSLGEKQRALDTYAEALDVAMAIGDRDDEASVRNGIGAVYASIGENQKALDQLTRALPLRRATEDTSGEAATLNNIGRIQRDLGNRAAARDYHLQALALWRKRGDRDGQAVALGNLGTIANEENETARASAYFAESLALYRAIDSRSGIATALTNTAIVHRSAGELDAAARDLTEALQLRRAVQDAAGESATLLERGRLERDRGNLRAAAAHLEEAVRITEVLRTKIAGDYSRATYLATVRPQYDTSIDVLMRMDQQEPAVGHAGAALQMSERARARSLLDLLNQAHVDIRAGVDPVLLERERVARQRLSARAERQSRLLNRKHSPAEAVALSKEIDALALELQETTARIRATSPQYAALTQPVPLSLKEIQDGVLDEGTLLLEYALGESRSHLWVVSSRSVTSFALPRRTEVEAVARRFYDGLTARNRRVDRETAEARARRIQQSDRQVAEAGAALSRMLLQPAGSLLGRHRLLIVTDASLQFIPFGALPILSASRPNGGPPVVTEHEVVRLPSASILAASRRALAGRAPAPRSVAVVADPVFSIDDPRVKIAAATRETPSAPASALTRSLDEIERSAVDVGVTTAGSGIPRLPFTRREADGILGHVSSRDALRAVDFAARRSLVAGGDLGLYRIVHFATHGLLNDQHPELSGLVLSLVNEQGQPEDGFLRLNEIYNLKLPADLVVLSACQTGLGKEIRGEGLFGLTRGFMYAGASGVLASQWKVDDAATAELMRRFYAALFGPGHMRPAAALRSAQLSLSREPRWASPYFWAAFDLQGEWR